MNYFDWLGANLQEPSFWFQPVFYALHGYVATEMALMMLFRPYEPWYLPGTKIQLPFTPGIFPRGQHKLSVAIATTITETLLTPEDLRRQTAKLVTEENIRRALDALIDSIGGELRDISQIRSLYKFVDDLVPPLLNRVVNDAILALERGDDKEFNAILDRFFTYALPRMHINREQATWVIDQIFNTLLPPQDLRLLVIDILTDQNIEAIDRTVRRQVRGIQGLLVQFLDIKKGMQEFRHFLLREPEEAEAFLLEILDRTEVREKLTTQLMLFSPHNLAIESLEMIRHSLIGSIRSMLVDHRDDISQMLSTLSEEATHSLTHRLLHHDFSAWAEKSLPSVKQDLARFIHTYLHKQLENLLSQALPALGMSTVIEEKINHFSARELEAVIQKICSRELRSLAFLGAFLGLWLGLLSNLLAFWIHPLPPPTP
jgi:uncharacterized membrane protein YheB (UPF0754 family)